ncbi:4301_t:CDS:2 [Scutellospora calospora]|uniref:4301_t:CDS:1 n=1 Tax=Scutellospora calospora TaxID=85575 RepID=A0ACA9K5L9_9GLOM|nr:4301_t:CDS:2 [Scutellospora calospora]
MSSSKFKVSNKIKKRGSYKLQVKAKLSSHLLLKEEDRLRLKYLLDISAPSENSFNIDPDDATITWYPYVGCLAFALIFFRNDEICGIVEYLEHSEQYLFSQLQYDSQYRLLSYVKKSVENLINFNIKTSDILAQNARINIDIKNDAAKNLDQMLRPKADHSELKEVYLYYQLHIKENNCLEIIISTHKQQKYA